MRVVEVTAWLEVVGNGNMKMHLKVCESECAAIIIGISGNGGCAAGPDYPFHIIPSHPSILSISRHAIAHTR